MQLSRQCFYVLVLIQIIVFVTIASAFWPGFMSQDSIEQFRQSITGDFDDWHPPIMSILWNFLNAIHTGPELMLFFQLGVFFVGILGWIRLYFTGPLSYLIVFFSFLPWVVNFSGVIWKDTILAFTLLLTAVSIKYYLRNRDSKWLVLITVLMIFGASLRHNAIIALVPMIYLVVRAIPSKRRFIFPLLLFAFFYISNLVIHHQFDVKKTSPQNYFIYDDLTAISVSKNTALVPLFTLDEIKRCNESELAFQRLVGRISCYDELSYTSGSKSAPIISVSYWLKQILLNPYSYIDYRIETYKYFLRLDNLQPYYFWHPGILKNDFNLSFSPNILEKYLNSFVIKTVESFPLLFTQKFWLFVNLTLIVLYKFINMNDNSRVEKYFLYSGFLYSLTYFFFTPLADFRYIYWQVLIVSIISLTIFFNKINSLFYFTLKYVNARKLHLPTINGRS